MTSESSQFPSQPHHHHPRAEGFFPFGPARARTGFGRSDGFPPGFGHGAGFGPGRGFGGFGGGGPRGFMGPGQRRRKGAARDAILSLLAEGPANGYGLIKAISDKTGGSWTPSPGSVYPTLQQLVDEGLIEATSEDKRSDFQLTDEGRTYVTEHAEELADVLKGASEHTEANAGLHESVAKLMGVLHQVKFAATDEQRAAAIAQIDETRRALYRILGE
ncbi:PadR family transcriptional regulator [Glaciihabitans tibetensis]|uniref:PadR family transcriptional regulator n=1 Tax=Glaciihabitans tibetensis TaxID=1266600 RepID=A0A2T0VE50_9MICO|nr:PadR family transcriptional regulator [Glaciihabitans tibetensis]PRY68467.1 PadR family transcriptional regulator [Glaciihabitans tibetensis]